MSAAHTYLAQCPDIQQELDTMFLTCDSSRLREPAPFADFVISTTNRGSWTQTVSPGGGKVRTVVARYDQRLLESGVTKPGTCTRSCTATDRRGDLTASYTIDPCDYYEESELIKANELAYSCQDNQLIVNGKIQRMIDVVIRRIQTDITADAATQLGKWNSLVSESATVTQDVLIINTLKASSTDLNPFAWVDVDLALRQSMWCNGAYVFAGPTFFKYAQILNAGCCANQGVDLGAIQRNHGYVVQYDKRVAAAASGTVNGAWAVAPGALQVIHYEENTNMFDSVADPGGHNYKKMVIQDPASGMLLDLDISDNCGALSIFVRGNYKLVSAPTDMFATGDEMDGVTGFAALKVTNT